MIEHLKTPVTVVVKHDHKTKNTCPVVVKWEGRLYKIEKLGLHHTYRRGATLVHVYCVMAKTLAFRLVLDTSTLVWELEEVSDGLTT